MTGTGDFWSRRKAAVAAEQEADERAIIAQAEADELAKREEQTDSEILEELNLPDPDHLKAGDDITGFMSKAVPERLRQRALRRLWRLNPVLANVDGLVDYGEDFTDAAVVMDGMQTAYQVGKGMLAHVQEMARQAEAEAEDGPEADKEPLESDIQAVPEIEPAPAYSEPVPARSPEVTHVSRDEPDADEEVAAPRAKRMRFEFGASAPRVKLTTGTT